MAFKINTTTRIDDSRNITGVGITGTSFTGIFPAGTAAFFVQTSSPTGWTKSTTHNDKALRIVNGAASSGGSVAFSTCYSSSVSVGGSINGASLSATHMPSHGHYVYYNSFAGDLREIMGYRGGDGNKYGAFDDYTDASNYSARAYGANVGSGSAHTHSFSGTALNLAIQYVDCIIATKD
jgi:hypothetical protein